MNTDAGCLTNGEPIGASGLRQIYESSTHLYGSPGVSACTILTT